MEKNRKAENQSPDSDLFNEKEWEAFDEEIAQELNSPDQALYEALNDIVEDVIDAFGRDQFNNLSDIFQELSKLSIDERQKLVDKIKEGKRFKIVDTTTEPDPKLHLETSIFYYINLFFLNYKTQDINPTKSKYYSNLRKLKEIYLDQSGKKLRETETKIQNMLLIVMNQLGFQYSNISADKLIRFIHLKNTVEDIANIEIDVNDSDSLYNVVYQARLIGLYSTIIFLTSEFDELNSITNNNIFDFIKRMSRFRSSVGRNTGKDKIYDENLLILDKYIRKKMSDQTIADTRTHTQLIEDFCIEKNEEIKNSKARNDKKINEIKSKLKQFCKDYKIATIDENMDIESYIAQIDTLIETVSNRAQEKKDSSSNKDNTKVLSALSKFKDDLKKIIKGYEKNYCLSPKTLTEKYNDYRKKTK